MVSAAVLAFNRVAAVARIPLEGVVTSAHAAPCHCPAGRR